MWALSSIKTLCTALPFGGLLHASLALVVVRAPDWAMIIVARRADFDNQLQLTSLVPPAKTWRDRSSLGACDHEGGCGRSIVRAAVYEQRLCACAPSAALARSVEIVALSSALLIRVSPSHWVVILPERALAWSEMIEELVLAAMLFMKRWLVPKVRANYQCQSSQSQSIGFNLIINRLMVLTW